MSDPLAEMMAEAGLSPDSDDQDLPAGHRSGFVALVGRPNVGKSTLLNQILGEKVSITSARPQTTRHAIRGILQRPDAQVVFVDTPGIHKPRTPMGERLNDTARSALSGVDVVCLLVDAAAGFGTGDRLLAEQLGEGAVLVLNKCDRARPARVAEQLAAASEIGFAEFFPISARTGEGVDELVEYLLSRLGEGPRWYPAGTTSDVTERFRVAELVREQLLAVTHDELPHSIATTVTEWEWPRIRVEISVERDSQKPIVIGKGGAVLKEVGTRVRRQLPEGAYLELHVSVDRDWQRNPRALDRHGYGTTQE
ncbi:MAG: GTPase Era [Microthrixaceae bacterium]|nr:GTPase Era [Microthrixaceae bacterium]MCO5322032.1 GTPase Era [Microthrixaceae bacterium]